MKCPVVALTLALAITSGTMAQENRDAVAPERANQQDHDPGVTLLEIAPAEQAADAEAGSVRFGDGVRGRRPESSAPEESSDEADGDPDRPVITGRSADQP